MSVSAFLSSVAMARERTSIEQNKHTLDQKRNSSCDIISAAFKYNQQEPVCNRQTLLDVKKQFALLCCVPC